jgi:rhodanese-related sulfurtransferase
MTVNLSDLPSFKPTVAQSIQYQDISPSEAYDLLTSPTNGIQVPIDVRTENEWRVERIDTPYPEHPLHFASTRLANTAGLQDFIESYNGKTVILYCRTGGRSASSAQILADSSFQGTIYNMLGGITAWKSAGYISKQGNQAPQQPAQPLGPTNGIIGQTLTFSVSTEDPDNDVVRHGWDWDGDDIVDQWTSYVPSLTEDNITHSWEAVGVYDVQVIAEDNVGDTSPFSPTLTVTIPHAVNHPPTTPEITGPARLQPDIVVNYTVVTTDPENDGVYYNIDFGDLCPTVEWLGPFPSGEPQTFSHVYHERGTYTIRVQAKDIFEEMSDWGTLEVAVPKFIPSDQLLQIRLLEYLFSLLAVLAPSSL